MIGFPTQIAGLWLQVTGDMQQVYMIANGMERANYLTASSSNTRTNGPQIKPAVAGITTNKRRWLWIMNGDLPERESPLKKFAWF